jgi:hypothetical protein
MRADTRSSKQALVDRCLDDDVALQFKEQLPAACRGRAEEREGEEGEADSEDGEGVSEDDAGYSFMYLGSCPKPKSRVVPPLIAPLRALLS